MNETQKKSEIVPDLSQWVSHPDRDIFAIKGLEGIVGAVYARYSRAGVGFKETLVNEFVNAGVIDATHAQELIERVLVAYGDDSVGELEGAHVSFEKVSAIAEKAIVDHRIGGAFIVQSTRYVFFDQKDPVTGKFRYHREARIMASPLAAEYERVMDFCFQTYCDLLKPFKKFLKSKKPITEAEYDINGDGKKERLGDLTDPRDVKAFKRTYNADVRSKACDTIRAVLPLATHHNVGVFGNGRFFQQMLSDFYTNDLAEVQTMGKQGHEALDQVIPRYVKRAKRNEYVAQTELQMKTLVNKICAQWEMGDKSQLPLSINAEQETSRDRVDLIDMPSTDQEYALHVTVAMLYEYTNLGFRELLAHVRELPPEMLEIIRASYIGRRETRRDRPGRALEYGYPNTFDLVVPFQVFKDLQRHRMSTQLWQKFTPHLGFRVPQDLEDLGLGDQVRACEREVRALYDKLVAAGLGNEAQYVVLHGHMVRWMIGLNDRAMMHMTELRSTPQGHPAYRKVAQLMHEQLAKRSTWRASAMKFVDYNDYYWSRAESEAKQRAKEREIDEKYKKQTV